MKKGVVIFLILILGVASYAKTDEEVNDTQVLEPIVVTPYRTTESPLTVGKNVTVINEEEISRSSAQSVPELLKSEAGIVVRDTLGNGKSSQVDIRGFGESAPMNVLVLVNGRRTNQIDISGTDWMQIDIDSIEKIEVVRGSQSVLYGDNAVGGVVNIITKSGAGKKPAVGGSYEMGSYKYNKWRAFVEGGSDFLDFYSAFSSSCTNGYRINNTLEAIDWAGNFTMKPTDEFRIKGDFGYHKDFYGLPGALFPNQLNTIGRDGSQYPDDRGKTEDWYLMATPELEKSFDFGTLEFATDLSFRSRRNSARNYFFGAAIEYANHVKTFGVNPKLVIDTNFGHKFVGGLDYYGNKFEVLQGMPGFKDKIIIEKQSLGLYAMDTWEVIPNLFLNGGFRGEWAMYDFDQQAVLRGTAKRDPFEYAWEGGLTYKYNENSSIYGNASRSFRMPATDEYFTALWIWGPWSGGGLNLGLKPQRAMSYEVGIKDNTIDFLEISCDYFFMDVDKEIYLDPRTGLNTNYDRQTIHHGFEGETRVYLFDNLLDVFFNYTFEKAYFVKGIYAGNDIPMVPEHKFSGGINIDFMDSVHFNYTATFVGRRRLISDQGKNVDPLKAYLTHDISLSYRKEGFEVYGAIKNILNERYSDYAITNAAGTAQGYYPSPERSFIVGVKQKF